MKVGSAVIGAHIAVLVALSLTQGCLTTGSQDSERGIAYKKGPFQHTHKGKAPSETVSPVEPMPVGMGTGLGDGDIYQPIDMQVNTIDPMPTPPASTTETYIVRKGDTISQLAVDYDTTTAELVRMNNLSNPDVLYVGQELVVPAGRRGGSTSSGKSSASSVKKGGTYTIQKGDTLSEIAIAADVSIDALRQLNGIKGDMIRAGDTIDIPAGGKIPSTKKVTKKKTPKTETKTATQTEPAPAPDLALPDLDTTQVDTVAPVVDAPEGIIAEDRILYPGETLEDIAREYGISKDEILRSNPQFTDESQIKDGVRLRIPISE